YSIFVSSYVDAIVTGVHHLQPAKVPKMPVDLNSAIARGEGLGSEVDNRLLVPKGKNLLRKAHHSVVTPCNHDCGGIVIRSTPHEDCRPGCDASDCRMQCCGLVYGS